MTVPYKAERLTPDDYIGKVSNIQADKQRTVKPGYRISIAGNQGEKEQGAGSDNNQQIHIADHFKWQFNDTRCETEHPQQIKNVWANNVTNGNICLVAVGRNCWSNQLRAGGSHSDKKE